jgi:hypothetical protein
VGKGWERGVEVRRVGGVGGEGMRITRGCCTCLLWRKATPCPICSTSCVYSAFDITNPALALLRWCASDIGLVVGFQVQRVKTSQCEDKSVSVYTESN